MASRLYCDTCQKGLDPKTDIYYSITDISKHVPKKGYRMVFQEGETSVKAEDCGWVSYEQLDFCQDCIKLPFDLWVHFSKGDDHV